MTVCFVVIVWFDRTKVISIFATLMHIYIYHNIPHSPPRPKVCGFLAPCFAIVALALATLELFLCDKCCIGLFVSILFSFATIAQSLTFMFLRSESFCSVTGCNMGDGAIYSIVAVSVMFVAGCTLGCIPKSEPLLMPGGGGGGQ